MWGGRDKNMIELYSDGDQSINWSMYLDSPPNVGISFFIGLKWCYDLPLSAGLPISTSRYKINTSSSGDRSARYTHKRTYWVIELAIFSINLEVEAVDLAKKNKYGTIQ